MKTNRSEKGQAFVLIIVAIVAIFGFAALAVDGGNVYAERRRAQNAADASALAAASAKEQGKDWSQAGKDLAAANGFDDGTNNDVIVNNPPVGGPYDGDDEYFQVIIQSEVEPIFSQFIYTGAQKQSVEAVVRYTPVTDSSSGNAIWGLEEDEESVTINGDADLVVEGGNIFSNGTGDKTGGSGTVVVKNGGKLVTVDGWVKEAGITGDFAIAPAPQRPNPLQRPYCPPPSDPVQSYKGINYYYHADGSLPPKIITLDPGVHCFEGGIDLNGGGKLTGHNVLLVFLNDGIIYNGNSATDLTRMDSVVDPNNHQYGGLLIWAANATDMVLGGTNDSFLTGTVYSPNAMCDIGGTSESQAIHSAFICKRFKLHGTAEIHIVYKEEENLRISSTLSVYQ